MVGTRLFSLCGHSALWVNMICDPLTDALWLLSAHLSTSLHSLCVDTGFSESRVMASSGPCCLVLLFSPTYTSPRTFALVLFCLVLVLGRGFLCIAMAVLELSIYQASLELKGSPFLCTPSRCAPRLPTRLLPLNEILNPFLTLVFNIS